jgi:hypothetical protein
MVIGPPSAICFVNKGTTEPLEPRTFPKRVVTSCYDHQDYSSFVNAKTEHIFQQFFY